MLGQLFVALDNYLHDLADDSWLTASAAARDILRKSVTPPGGNALSIIDRFSAVSNGTSAEVRADKLLVHALVVWRNQTVHELRARDVSRTRLSNDVVDQLLSHANVLKQRYGKFDVAIFIEHVKHGRPPTRKDIIAVASAAQNYVRAVDEKLIRDSIQSRDNVEQIALLEIRTALLKGSDDSEFRRVWGKDIETRKRRLISILEQAGFAPDGDLVPSIGPDLIDELALATATVAREKLESTRKL